MLSVAGRALCGSAEGIRHRTQALRLARQQAPVLGRAQATQYGTQAPRLPRQQAPWLGRAQATQHGAQAPRLGSTGRRLAGWHTSITSTFTFASEFQWLTTSERAPTHPSPILPRGNPAPNSSTRRPYTRIHIIVHQILQANLSVASYLLHITPNHTAQHQYHITSLPLEHHFLNDLAFLLRDRLRDQLLLAHLNIQLVPVFPGC